MGKKKRSVLAEIKRTEKNQEKSQVQLKTFVIDDREFKIVPPKSLKNPEEQFEKFALFLEKVVKIVGLTLAKTQETFVIKKVFKDLAEKIQPHLNKYFIDYSLEEKKFLIMTYSIKDLGFLSEIIGEKDVSTLEKIFNTQKCAFLTAYLNFHTFKKQIPEFKEMFSEFWDFVDSNLFT